MSESNAMFKGDQMTPAFNFGETHRPAMTFLCPVCFYDYVHHEAATVVVAGKDDYKASVHCRGSVICIPMNGECGHRWSLLIGFHKGQTTFWCERLADLPENPEDHPITYER